MFLRWAELTSERSEVRVRYCGCCEAQLIDGYCEYCRIPDADGWYGDNGRQSCLDIVSDRTVLCEDSNSVTSDDRLYDGYRDGFENVDDLDRRHGSADWLSRDEMVSRVYVVFFMVFVLWLSFLVTIVLIVLLL